MTSRDFNTAVAIVICAFIGLGLFVLWTQRKSKSRPNRRTGLPKPSAASTRYLRPGSL